jgi:hypothetical protein
MLLTATWLRSSETMDMVRVCQARSAVLGRRDFTFFLLLDFLHFLHDRRPRAFLGRLISLLMTFWHGFASLLRGCCFTHCGLSLRHLSGMAFLVRSQHAHGTQQRSLLRHEDGEMADIPFPFFPSATSFLFHPRSLSSRRCGEGHCCLCAKCFWRNGVRARWASFSVASLRHGRVR